MAAAFGVGFPQARPGSPGAPPVWASPITINAGGTYSGNWRSSSAATPAVTIATADPVTLVDFRTESPGHHIYLGAGAGGADLVTRNGHAVGLNSGVAGQPTGRYVADAAGIATLVVEQCTLVHTGGIYLDGGGSTGLTLLRVRGNKCINIDGRLSDGAGGYQASGGSMYQFVQINRYLSIAELDIDWNYVINNAGRSLVEDVISMYRSGGVVGRHARVWNNCIRGAYPRDPLAGGYSGGGIIVDGDSTSSTDCARYNSIKGNVVLGTTNHGIAIAAGLDGSVEENRVLCSGRLPRDGQLLASANVGVYIWDVYGDTAAGAFGSNTATNNYIGWINSSGSRNDSWTPDGTITGTTGPAGPPTTADYEAEVSAWNVRREAAGVPLGCTLPFQTLAENAIPIGSVTATGAATQGQVLTAVTSGISDPDGLGALSYQWLRNGADIAAATSSTYTLAGPDAGTTVAARVTWTDGRGCRESLTSAGRGPIT